MKRRTFLILGSLGLAGNICGWLNRLQPPVPDQLPGLTETPRVIPTQLPTSTPFPPPTPEAGSGLAAPVEPAVLETTQTPSAPTQVAGDLVVDEFSDPAIPVTRTIQADSAAQVSIAEGRLLVRGAAPGQNDPAIYDRQPIPREDGQVTAARFQVAFGRETGRIGLRSPDGQVLACIRRTTAEGLGGILECGPAAYPVLNLYSGCWYDFVVFLQPGRTAFAINDGAGLELVLVSGGDGSTPSYLGYWTGGGEDQGVCLEAWYAPGPRFFPPELVSRAVVPLDFEADLATNAAWVEVGVTREAGNAGLRFRSVDGENEYRVYLDGTNLKVVQMVKGITDPIANEPVLESPGARLAVRYNELTMTVYYNGVPTKVINRKIGAPPLVAATKIGIYSTDPANTFTGLSARAVRLEIPAGLGGRLLDTRRVLCLGDSLTNGDKAFGYQNGLRKSLGDAWVTVDGGVSGQTTYQMLTRLPSHLIRYVPEVLVVMGGTNDIDRDYKEESIKANLQAIYRTARQAGARVAAVTVPPIAGYHNWSAEKQALVERVNAWILGSAQSVDFRVDAYHLLKDPAGDGLLAAYDSGDHIHLSGSGYDTLANVIFRKVTW